MVATGMSAPYATLLLDTETYDLTLDANNNIALATSPYSVAQDMGSQCRQWQGEYCYDVNDGVPLASILGQSPNLGVMKSDFVAAAAEVPATSNVKCFIEAITDRRVQGQVQATVTLADGSTVVVSANISPPVRFLKFLTNDAGTEYLTPDGGGGPLMPG